MIILRCWGCIMVKGEIRWYLHGPWSIIPKKSTRGGSTPKSYIWYNKGRWRYLKKETPPYYSSYPPIYKFVTIIISLWNTNEDSSPPRLKEWFTKQNSLPYVQYTSLSIIISGVWDGVSQRPVPTPVSYPLVSIRRPPHGSVYAFCFFPFFFFSF